MLSVTAWGLYLVDGIFHVVLSMLLDLHEGLHAMGMGRRYEGHARGPACHGDGEEV